MLRIRAARSKTKLFWSWVNFVWLHLHSSQSRVKTIATLWILSTKNLFLVAQPGGYHFIAACQGCFNCTKLLKRFFFGNSWSEFCSH